MTLTQYLHVTGPMLDTTNNPYCHISLQAKLLGSSRHGSGYESKGRLINGQPKECRR